MTKRYITIKTYKMIMKKLVFTLFTALLLASCSVYEDIYLNNDKSINYLTTFEITEGNGMEGMLKNKFPADSVISMKDILSEELAKGAEITDEMRGYLESLEVFTLRMKLSDDGKKYQMILRGDFKDDKHLNTTIDNMSKLMSEAQEASSSTQKMDFFNAQWNISWDGKTMKRTMFNTESEKNDTEGDIAEKKMNMDMMTKAVKGQVRYHFEKKVKKVNDPNALMTQDAKTVVIIPNDMTSASEEYTVEIKVK